MLPRCGWQDCLCGRRIASPSPSPAAPPTAPARCGEEWGQSEDVCGQLAELYFFYTIWFGVYAGLSAAVARRAAGVRRLLNPVTSGMVV